MCKRLYFLRALALAVQKKLNLVKIGMHPHRNRFALSLLPIPMRKQVQDRFLTPPRLVVIKVVFGKAAHIYNAELRVDRGPAIRSWFAAIVETGPGKSSRQPFPGGIEFPPLLREFSPLWMIRIVGAHPITKLAGDVDAARRDRTGGF